MIAAHQTMLAPPALPYDAEVEYVESTGAQYIDTGVNADGSVLGAEIDIDCDSGNFGGAIRKVNSSYTRMHFSVASGLDLIYIGSNPNFQISHISGRRVFRYDAQNQTGVIGSYTAALVPVAPTDTTISFWLFGRHGLDINNSLCSAKIYAANLWQNGTLVRSFVPVRVGSVGYLYDRANPTGGPSGNGLYGSATSTPLVAGPDENGG